MVCADFDVEKRNSACKFGLQRVPRPLTLNLTLKVKGQGNRKSASSVCKFGLQRVPRPLNLEFDLEGQRSRSSKVLRHLPTWFARILTSKKRNSACKFGLQRVPRPLTLNLTLKVKGQGHRKYCDTCPRGLR